MHSLITSELDTRTSRARLESRLSKLQIGLFVQYALLDELDTLLEIEYLLQNLFLFFQNQLLVTFGVTNKIRVIFSKGVRLVKQWVVTALR